MVSEYNQLTLAVVLYRIITVLVGFVIARMGYKLFEAGVFRKAGEISADIGDKSLFIRGAPGTFFALFGFAVIGVSIWKGVDFQRTLEEANQCDLALQWCEEAPEIGDILKKVLREESLNDLEKNRIREYRRIESHRVQGLKPMN